MCGICGVVSFRDEPVRTESLARACRALRHRGPDQSDIWLDTANAGAVGLGATRLKVLDTSSPAAGQPMHDPSGRFHLVYNGEVYNFRAIRAELRANGGEFRTEGDTEVVLAACARWGLRALDRFNGMWALCFYDSVERRGFLARDRFGIKPLFYSTVGTSLRFASELGAVRRLGAIDDTIDDGALLQHLHFGYIAHPDTIYRHVRRLAPGGFLRFTTRGADEPGSYYDPLTSPPVQTVGTGAVADEHVSGRSRGGLGSPQTGCAGGLGPRQTGCAGGLVRAIGEAVGVRRVSDVPVGAFLSGGMDSSIVVHHLAAVTPEPVRTFCVGYEGQRCFDERRFARIVAERYGTEHHEIVVSERDALALIPRILDHLGEPFGDASIIPASILSGAARRHVTVALSGDGGDELFGGYWRYLGHATLNAYARLPGPLRRFVIEPLVASLAASKAGAAANRIRQFRKLLRAQGADPFARHVAWSRILSPEAECILSDPDRSAAVDAAMVERARSATAAMPGDDPLNRVLGFDLVHQLPADMLHKTDLASMMHSLEVRVPLLDPRIVETALGLPSGAKLDRGLRKRVLIDAYRGILPDEVLDRPKQGFEIPIGEYLRGPLRSMFFDVVNRSAVESFGLLTYAGVERIAHEHLSRRADHTDLLFALLSLCWWQRSAAAAL